MIFMNENINQGGKSKLKVRKNISVDPDLWENSMVKAKKNQQNLSSVISALLLDWLAGRYKPTGEE